MSYKGVFDALTDQEFAVLYWRCQGLRHQDIARKFGYSIPWIQEHSTKLQRKLGFPKDMHPARRAEIIENEVCPDFQKWIEDHPEKVKRLPEPLEAEHPAVIEGKWTDKPPPQPEPPPIEIKPQPLLTGGMARRGCATLVFVGFIVALIGGLSIYRNLLSPATTATPQQEPVQITATVTPEIEHVALPTPSVTPEPTLTFTPETPPTAVPLPIKENFNSKYSLLWTEFGNPIVVERTRNSAYGYSGVLTSGDAGSATIMIGNSAWSNLIVSLRGNCWDCMNPEGKSIIIGVRVKDINNMVALKCGSSYNCGWVVFKDGAIDELPSSAPMSIQRNLKITVQGDTFLAVGEDGNGNPLPASMVLPPKYKGQYMNGGVLLQVTQGEEIDFVEIQPLP